MINHDGPNSNILFTWVDVFVQNVHVVVPVVPLVLVEEPEGVHELVHRDALANAPVNFEAERLVTGQVHPDVRRAPGIPNLHLS